MAKSKEELEKLELKLKNKDKDLANKSILKTSKLKTRAAVILTYVSIAAGLFGILFPSIKHLTEQKGNRNKLEINKKMVAFVNDLNSENDAERDNAVMGLIYYEADAVPILLHKLEQIHYNEKNIICSTLKTIKNLSRKNKLLIEKMLLKNAIDFYDRAYLNPDGEVLNRIYGMLNYVFALGELGEKKKIDFNAFLDKISNTIDQCEIDKLTKGDLVTEVTKSKGKLK